MKTWYELFIVDEDLDGETRTIDSFDTLAEAKQRARWLIDKGWHNAEELHLDRWVSDGGKGFPEPVEEYPIKEV